MTTVLLNVCIGGLFLIGYVCICTWIFNMTFGENSAFIIEATSYWWIVFWLLPFSYYLFLIAVLLIDQCHRTMDDIKNWYNKEKIAIEDANLKLRMRCWYITGYPEGELTQEHIEELDRVCDLHVQYCHSIGLSQAQIKKVFYSDRDGAVAKYINDYGNSL